VSAQQESYSVSHLAGSLAMAFALPALTSQALAQTADGAAVLAPVQVQGETVAPYAPPAQASQSKFTAPLVDTPKSVQVIPKTVIQDTAATSLQDVLRNSPGITFGAGEGGQPLADRPFIRGASSANNIFVDGIRDPGGQTREVFNLESVEVVRGADSALGGRGSGGGSINMVTKKAQLGTFAEGTASVGTDQYWRGTVDGNWQFDDTSAFRLNAMGTKGNVAGRSEVGYDKWGIAPSLSFGLGTPTRVTLSYYHLQTHEDPDYGVPLARKIPGNRTSNGLLDIDREEWYGLYARDFRENKSDIATLDVQHDFNSNLTVRNATRYGQTLNHYIVTNPGDGGSPAFDPVTQEYWMRRGTKGRWNQATMLSNVTELYGKFTTGTLKHSFDVGVEFTRERNKNDSITTPVTTVGSPCPAVLGGLDCTPLYHPNPHDPWEGTTVRTRNSDTTSNTRAIYAFDTIDLNEQWQVNLGGRFDNYRIDGSFLQRGDTALQDGEGSWNIWSYQAGIVYKPAPNGSIYLSYATGSTPPTVGGGDQESLSAGIGQLDPERSRTIELGTKWEVLDERLSLTGAVFQTDRKNGQIQVGPDTTDLAQAGKTRVRGLELGFSGAVTPRWNVFGGYTYMDSELVKAGFNTTAGGIVGEGGPLPNTPRNSFSLWNTYKVTSKWAVGGGVYYVGKIVGGNQGSIGGNGATVELPDYFRFDAMTSYEVSRNLTLQLNVMNLTDKKYYTSTNGSHYALYGPGRQFILSANVRY